MAEIHADHPEFLAEIEDKKVISEELEAKLAEFYKKFSQQFGETIEKAA